MMQATKKIIYVKWIGYCQLIDKPQLVPKQISIQEKSQQVEKNMNLSMISKIDKNNDPEIIPVKFMRTSYIGYICKQDLKTEIIIKVKSFLKSGKCITLTIGINQSIDDLKKMIFKQLDEKISDYINIRLFYVSGDLIELTNNLNKVLDYYILENSKLVLILSQKPKQLPTQNNNEFLKLTQITQSIKQQISAGLIYSYFDTECLDIKQLDTNKIQITKTRNDFCINFLKKPKFGIVGRFVWEVHIKKFRYPTDIYLGVANSTIVVAQNPIYQKGYWGYIPGKSKKFTQGIHQDYGTQMELKIKDIIKIQLYFQNGLGNLIFHRNGVNLGIAFEKIQGILFPAITLFSKDSQVIITHQEQI